MQVNINVIISKIFTINLIECFFFICPNLVHRFLLIPPELGFNIFGTIWAFCDLIDCSTSTDHTFSKTVIEGKHNYLL